MVGVVGLRVGVVVVVRVGVVVVVGLGVSVMVIFENGISSIVAEVAIGLLAVVG